MSKIVDIFVTKETVSDDGYKVTSILFKDAERIKKGDIIGSFETSKADVDVESPIDGYVFYNCRPESIITVGSIFASIAESASLPASYFETKAAAGPAENKPETKVDIPADMRISKPAEKLIREHNIDVSVFKGKSIIEKKDVEEYINKAKKQPATLNSTGSRPAHSRSNSLIILGGGNHTKVCIDIVRQMHAFQIAGIVYTRSKPASDSLMDCPVLGGLDELENIFKHTAAHAVIGIGGLDDPKERTLLYERLKGIGYFVPNLIHPRAVVEPSAILGEGNQVMGGANICSCAVIGNNCIINSNSVVSHDCVIGDNVHITPGAVLAGTVKVGDNSIIGMGVTLFYNCNVGKNVIINNGHHIFKNIPDNSIIK